MECPLFVFSVFFVDWKIDGDKEAPKIRRSSIRLHDKLACNLTHPQSQPKDKCVCKITSNLQKNHDAPTIGIAVVLFSHVTNDSNILRIMASLAATLCETFSGTSPTFHNSAESTRQSVHCGAT